MLRPASMCAATIVALATVNSASVDGRLMRSGSALDFVNAIVKLSEGDWRYLRAGRTLVRGLPVAHDQQLAVFVASHIGVTPERFVERVRRSAALWKGDKVPATGSFSDPARPEDVRDLTLRSKDLESLRDCQPGDCALKLAASEIGRLHAAMSQAGAGWRDAVQVEFRRIVLDRTQAFRRGGFRALPAPHDHEQPVDLQGEAARLLASAPVLPDTSPTLADYIERYPHRPLPPGTEAFAYWLETNETPRPTIQGLHATVERRSGGDVEVLVVTRQMFSTHYLNGSLSVSALIRDPSDPNRRYLVYMNRSATDALGGFFSGLKRFFIERRVRGAARHAFERFKQRIEAPRISGQARPLPCMRRLATTDDLLNS